METQTEEYLANRVKGLSELELLSFMETLSEHLKKSKFEHLIDKVFEVNEDVIFGFNRDIKKLEDNLFDKEAEVDINMDRIEDLELEVKNLEKKIMEIEKQNNDNTSK